VAGYRPQILLLKNGDASHRNNYPRPPTPFFLNKNEQALTSQQPTDSLQVSRLFFIFFCFVIFFLDGVPISVKDTYKC